MSAESQATGTVGLSSKLSAALGGRSASVLERAFGMRTVGDLLAHYPRRYALRGELTALARLPLGEDVTIVAEVISATERRMRTKKGSIVEATITDGEGILTLTFFNQHWRLNELKPGVRGIFAGKVTEYRRARQLAHPDYELFEASELTPDSEAARAWAARPIPIYPATGSVASWRVQKAVGVALDGLGPVEDPLPEDVRGDGGLPYRRALELIHRPETEADWRAARESLRFQEAFVLQSALLAQRAAARRQPATPREARPGGFLERFDAALPFELTADQREVGARVAADLAATSPMNRLIQGEVGSGKTVVTLRAMLAVADSGGQAVLLAPTEVLAGQHLRSIAAILGPDLAAELMPTLVTGHMPAGERKKAVLRTVTGQARIVVGTHALLSEDVSFFDLGLVVVDEQHRFGVEQRDALRLKGTAPPHVLVLTATPIPRTVAMTVFGDLDVSTIAELPAGRARIESFVVPLHERPAWVRRIWERAGEEVAEGRQVFVVCPAISPRESEENALPPSEDAESAPHLANVEETLRTIQANPALGRACALHGRMSSEEKDATMRAFAAGEIDVLVATTVIEVGVDVPNASAMIVLDADRFGVSQLHQLRGRVGRGEHPGLCLFVTGAERGTLARDRVDAVAATLDGFELAQADLELRREGDVLGATQAGGRSSLRLLRVARDGELIERARGLAGRVLESDPELREHPALAQAVELRLDETERGFLGRG